MSTDPRDPPDETLESIADSLAVASPGPPEGDGAEGLTILAAVAGGFRRARREAPDSGDVSPAASGAEPARWGSLELRRRIGSGAFGEVWLAWDPALHRDVALKLRRAEAGVLRWLDEGRALARVRHPGVVVVHGADLRDGRAGLWMERIEGETLEERLTSRGPQPIDEVVRCGLQLAAALRAVHAAGLVHGDVKAANVMIEPAPDSDHEPRVVLMDFGMVRDLAVDEAPLATAGGGTPLAMPPETLDGATPDARADLYAFGVLLFRLLTGRYPVEARSLPELRQAHATGRPPALRSLRRDVPARLARLIDRALDPDPARRPHTAREVQAELRLLADPRGAARRRLITFGVTVTTLAVAVLAVLRLMAPSGELKFRSRPLSPPRDPGWAERAWTATGSNGHAELGWHAAGIGDLDGDGYEEAAVTEVWYGIDPPDVGRVRIFHGSPTGLEAASRGDLVGTQTDGAFGTDLAPAGDVNGDGHPDLLVSARLERGPGGAIGVVSLYVGDGAGLAPAPAWSWRTPLTRGHGFGGALVGGFDVNHDGYSDFLVGDDQATLQFEQEGAVWLFLGGPGGPSAGPAWQVTGGSAGAALGWHAASAGDVDADGFDDLVIGAHRWSQPVPEAGQARVYRGGPALPSTRPDWIITGTQSHGMLGTCVAGGDVDGDGYSDLLVGEGAHWSEGLAARGRILLYRGSVRGPSSRPDWEWRGPCTGARLGNNALLVHDVDGDGFADIAAGAHGYSPGGRDVPSGLVVFFRGGAGGPGRIPDGWLSGTKGNSGFGLSIGVVGPALEGRPGALLLGSPAAGAGGDSPGRVDLYRVRPAQRSRRPEQAHRRDGAP